MVTASYKIALIVVEKKKPHTIKELIMPPAKVLVKHVSAMKQVLTKIQSSKYGFAIQLDETTNLSNSTLLLVFVRYATEDSIRSELLLSNELKNATREEDVFDFIDNFFKENGLQSNKLVGCTTNGAPAMLGRKSRFQAFMGP